jgi:WD40-like Beta Propeller Repeat
MISLVKMLLSTMAARITVLVSGLVLSVADAPTLAVAAESVTHWAPPRISSPLFASHAAFDPLTGDLLFVRSSKEFRGWRILASHCGPRGWTEPRPAAFAAPGLEADPFFTADGRWLYFISTRATGSSSSQDLDIWRMKRNGSGKWEAPERLPEPVNSPGAEWFPRPAPDGWLYFGSDRPGGQGKTDIWRARMEANGQWHVENLGPSINGPGSEYEALPSPDGKHLIIEADEGYFESDLLADGWSPRRRLGPQINDNGSEIGAVFSPSGRSLLFARDIKGNDSGEFFLWQPDGPEDWPPSCPRKSVGR